MPTNIFKYCKCQSFIIEGREYMRRLYIRQGFPKREWLPVGWYCPACKRMEYYTNED